MTQDFKIFKKFFGIFVLLVTFEIISHYPNIDISHWLNSFWFLPVFVVVLIVIRLIVISY